MMQLHHVPLCPYCRKIRLGLREKAIACELVEFRPWEREEEYLKLNPAAEAPILIDGDAVVCDSRAISDYLEEAYTKASLFGRTQSQRNETRRLMGWFDSKFTREVTDLLWREKLLKPLKGGGTPDSTAIRAGSHNLRIHMGYISHLFDTRRWLAGDEMSWADLTAAAHISVLDYLGSVNWEGFEGARDWYAKMKSRPSFRPLLTERLVGLKPPAHYDDLDF